MRDAGEKDMNTAIIGKGSLVSLGLVALGLWAGVGCSSDPGPDDGSGGTGTGGTGTGGVSTGGSSTGGSGYVCNEELTGTGGAIGLFNCDHWLGEHGEEYALDFSCGQGGQGGNGGQGGASAEDPALQRVCEAPSNPDFNDVHPVFFCLEELTDDVCSEQHEADVIACLTQEAPCDEDLEEIGCSDKLDDCATLEVGTCYWAMVSARNPGAIDTCFSQPVAGESCDARFMRCAWDL